MSRVEWIRYDVVGVPSKTSYENDAFKVHITDGVALVYPKNEYGSVETAESAFDEFLRSFEAERAFQSLEPVRFTFRQGQEQDGRGVSALLYTTLKVTGPRATENLKHAKPWLFTPIATSSETAELVRRYDEYKHGRDKLATVAYVALSQLQRRAGGRGGAAARYRIDREVLDKVGVLSSTFGGVAEARKLDAQSEDRPLAVAETFWLECITRALIERLYTVEVEKQLECETITFSSLPPLGLRG